MNIINSLGSGSGIDTTSLISGLVSAERLPTETRLDQRQEQLDAQISGYGALKSALSEFKSLVSLLSNNDAFNARSAALPDTTLITANAIAPGAQTGTYQIEVLSVAQSHSLALEAVADKGAVLNYSGELSFQQGDWTYDLTDPENPVPTSFAQDTSKTPFSITIEASDSLSSIAQKINDAEGDIQASVLKIGDEYQLVVTGPPGASNGLSISGNDPSLSVLEFNQTNLDDAIESQIGSDSVVKVNGLTVSRDTNNLTDVIPGFDFTINRAEPGETISFTVEADNSIVEQGIRDLVEGYNLFYATAKNLTGYARDENNALIKGDLATDSSAKSLVQRLRSVLGSTVPGLSEGFTALSNLGIRTQLDGSLSIKESDFRAAIDNNFDQLEALFSPKVESSNSRIEVGFGSRVGETLTGNYQVEITQESTRGALTTNVLTETFASALDLTSNDTYSFKIAVGGAAAAEITLAGVYADADELALDLQTQINADATLTERGIAVDVTYDSGTNTFLFENRAYGSTSTVSFLTASASMASLGITSDLVGSAGVNVEGTINGVAGFGVGQVLLPEIGTAAYGLTFTALDGAAAEGVGSVDIDFSRGIAGELDRLIADFLSADGVIAQREGRIGTQLDEVSTEREELDSRIEKYEERISAQFLVMEQIINSLNSTNSALDGLADRLPFTSQRN